MLRFAFLIALAVCCAGLAASGCSCPTNLHPCPPTNVQFASRCGFTNFTTTCRAVSGHTITPNTSETCDVAMTLGDGTTHNAHLLLPDRAPTACPDCFDRQISVTVDGHSTLNNGGVVTFGSNEPFGPATCSPDAGIEDSGPTDSSLDSSADTSG